MEVNGNTRGAIFSGQHNSFGKGAYFADHPAHAGKKSNGGSYHGEKASRTCVIATLLVRHRPPSRAPSPP